MSEYYIAIPHDDYVVHHGVLGQKWGVRRYQNYDGSLTPAGRERYGESKQLASQLFEKAKAHEPRITKDVMDSVNVTSAKMYGLEHKLKTEESLTRKIRTDSEEKKITPFDAAYGIKDGVRYTALSPDNDFTSNYYKIKDSLEKKGYSEVRCKNYFDLYRQGQVKHKSVQSVFQSDDGYLFEMQFQTKASQDAKDKKVPIYEERRKPGLSKERQEALERQMVELAENVPDPKDVYKIKTHSSIKHSLGSDSMNYDELVHTLFAGKPPEEDYLAHHMKRNISDDYRKLYKTGKNGRDFDDEYEYVRPEASKKYKETLNLLMKDNKAWNSMMDNYFSDTRTKNRVSNFVNDLLDEEERRAMHGN